MEPSSTSLLLGRYGPNSEECSPLLSPNTYGTMEIGEGKLRNRQATSSSNTYNDNVEIGISSSSQSDPLGLLHWKKTEHEISQLKSKRQVVKFYRQQNELIDHLIAPLISAEEEEILNATNSKKLAIAIYGSTAANLLLLILQVIAAVFSGSLALFATTADAFMDLLSSLILLVANYLSGKPEWYGYPSGKSRFETVGIIIFGTLMSTLSFLILLQSLYRMVTNPTKPDLGIQAISLVLCGLLIKLGLYLYCRLLDHGTAQILAKDHCNDLFANSVGLASAILGTLINPYLDPIGALIISLVILHSWTSVVIEHSQLIVGRTAEPDFIRRAIYISMTHDERILQVDTCRAYYAGSKVIVEVDIVLPPQTSLQIAHDLGESLQIKLESLPNVERAFVHCDYETTHKPEHRKFA